MVNKLEKIDSKERYIKELKESYESTDSIMSQIFLFFKIVKQQRKLKRLTDSLDAETFNNR